MQDEMNGIEYHSSYPINSIGASYNTGILHAPIPRSAAQSPRLDVWNPAPSPPTDVAQHPWSDHTYFDSTIVNPTMPTSALHSSYGAYQPVSLPYSRFLSPSPEPDLLAMLLGLEKGLPGIAASGVASVAGAGEGGGIWKALGEEDTSMSSGVVEEMTMGDPFVGMNHQSDQFHPTMPSASSSNSPRGQSEPPLRHYQEFDLASAEREADVAALMSLGIERRGESDGAGLNRMGGLESNHNRSGILDAGSFQYQPHQHHQQHRHSSAISPNPMSVPYVTDAIPMREMSYEENQIQLRAAASLDGFMSAVARSPSVYPSHVPNPMLSSNHNRDSHSLDPYRFAPRPTSQFHYSPPAPDTQFQTLYHHSQQQHNAALRLPTPLSMLNTNMRPALRHAGSTSSISSDPSEREPHPLANLVVLPSPTHRHRLSPDSYYSMHSTIDFSANDPMTEMRQAGRGRGIKRDRNTSGHSSDLSREARRSSAESGGHIRMDLDDIGRGNETPLNASFRSRLSSTPSSLSPGHHISPLFDSSAPNGQDASYFTSAAAAASDSSESLDLSSATNISRSRISPLHEIVPTVAPPKPKPASTRSVATAPKPTVRPKRTKSTPSSRNSSRRPSPVLADPSDASTSTSYTTSTTSQRKNRNPHSTQLPGNGTRKGVKAEATDDHVGPSCSHCLAITTPLWRRGSADELLCNACGLYLKLHGESRPLTYGKQSIGSRGKTTAAGAASIAAASAEPPSCSNCAATSTPMWRKDSEKRLCCNACSLYHKLHGVPRPTSLSRKTKGGSANAGASRNNNLSTAAAPLIATDSTPLVSTSTITQSPSPLLSSLRSHPSPSLAPLLNPDPFPPPLSFPSAILSAPSSSTTAAISILSLGQSPTSLANYSLQARSPPVGASPSSPFAAAWRTTTTSGLELVRGTSGSPGPMYATSPRGSGGERGGRERSASLKLGVMVSNDRTTTTREEQGVGERMREAVKMR